METRDITLTALDGHVVNGTHKHVRDARATVLFVHGILGDRSELGYYDSLTSRLQELGIATLAIDYRGHGTSMIPFGQLTLAGVMLDIDSAWHYLRQSYPGKEIVRIISGNSFGAGVSYLHGTGPASADHIFLTMPVLSYVDDISRVNPQ